MRTRRIRLLLVLCAWMALLGVPGIAQADLSFVPGSVSVVTHNADGTIDARAGSHPASLVVKFKLQANEKAETEGGQLRNVVVDLPPGLVGYPTAVPQCPRVDLEGTTPECPTDTQIGVLTA